MVKLDIKQNTYYDSVTLMLISKDLKKLDGVEEALVGMGTDLNRDIAHNLGLVTPEFETIDRTDRAFALAVDFQNLELDLLLEQVLQAVVAGKGGLGGGDKDLDAVGQRQHAALDDLHDGALEDRSPSPRSPS